MKKRAISFVLCLMMAVTLLGNGIPVYAQIAEQPAITTEETGNEVTEDEVDRGTPSDAERTARAAEEPDEEAEDSEATASEATPSEATPSEATPSEAAAGAGNRWSVLEETPTNKPDVESEAAVWNPEVPKEITVSNKKFNIEKYKADPDDSRYTFAIVTLEDLVSNNKNTFNKKYGKDWYLTFSAPNDKSSANVKVSLVDAASNRVLEEKELTLNGSKISFDKLQEVGYQYSLAYSESADKNGTVTRNIRSSYTEGSTFVFTAIEPTLQGKQVNIVNLIVPNVDSSYSYYKVVGYDQYKEYLTNGKTYHSQRTGNEKDLSIYVIEGNTGQKFRASGTAEYDKYELVESADKNKTAEGILAKKYVPDTVTRTGVVRYAKRLQRVVNENGDAVVEMWILDPDKVNVKEYNAEQETGDEQIQTDKYKKIFETPVLKNGEWNPTAFEWNWEEDWVKKAGLKINDKENNKRVRITPVWKVATGGIHFPAIDDAGTGKNFSGGQAFRLQNDNNPRSDAYYYYVEKGSVMVHYEDTEGNVIQNPVTDTAHGVTGSGYNTTDHKDTSIKFNGETYYLVQKPAQKQIQANDAGVKTALATDTVTNNKLITETTSEMGEVRAATEIHLTYVYEKAGNVKVNYFGVDEHGNVLDPLSGATTGIDKTTVSTTEYVTKDAQSGTEYHTRTFKPATIRDAQGRIWRLVTASNPHPVTDGDAEAGTVVSGATKAVNYYYALETPAPSGGNGGGGGGGGGSSSHTPKPASVTLIAAKALNGAAPAGSSFTFFLNDANGQQLQAKNNQDGAVTFDALTFNQTGAYVYYLTEQTGNDKNINYDTASYKVTVTVTCPYDYEASVAYEKDGQAYQGVPAFANTTKPAVPVPEQIAPAVATARALDKVPKTEDSSGLALWGILAAASFLSLTVLLAGNKMRKASSQGKEHQS